jgi:excisionase family DNA binding protein
MTRQPRSRTAATPATPAPATPPAAPAFLDAREVATILHLSRNQVYDMLAAGELACVHLGRRRLVDAAYLARYVSHLRRTAAAQLHPYWRAVAVEPAEPGAE